MNNSERLAYIKGLMEGLDLDKNSKEVKVITAIVDLLDDMCLSMEEMEDDFDLLSGQVDEIDEDLGSLEEDFYEDCGCGCDHDHEDDHNERGCGCDCDCDDDCDGDCHCDGDCTCGHDHYYFEDDEDECQFEVTCPSCGDTIELDSETLDEGAINCPGCGVKLEFDFDELGIEEEPEEETAE
ncbi:MAG: hypothetical protein R3Y35_04655 [Clostridia bacterium]